MLCARPDGGQVARLDEEDAQIDKDEGQLNQRRENSIIGSACRHTSTRPSRVQLQSRASCGAVVLQQRGRSKVRLAEDAASRPGGARGKRCSRAAPPGRAPARNLP
eukprot:629768-Prymnesium_polylepis.1